VAVFVSVKVVALIVAAFMVSEKLAVTVVLVETSAALSSGETRVTVGGVLSALPGAP
jgi:hypothetical protein